MTLVARTRRGDRALPGAGSLLARCLAAGLPVGSSCSGRGACGRCMVRILEGEARLTPAEPHERDVVARMGGEQADRLACCAHPAGSGTIVLTAGYW